jgi:hypothetical protein
MWFLAIDKENGYPGPYNDRESATETGLEVAAKLNASINLLYFQYDSESGAQNLMAVIQPCGCVKNDPKFNRLGDYERKCEGHNDK